jgi:hypothetical protein
VPFAYWSDIHLPLDFYLPHSNTDKWNLVPFTFM